MGQFRCVERLALVEAKWLLVLAIQKQFILPTRFSIIVININMEHRVDLGEPELEVLGSQMKFQPLLDRTFDDFELGFPSSFLVSWSNLLSLKRALPVTSSVSLNLVLF